MADNAQLAEGPQTGEPAPGPGVGNLEATGARGWRRLWQPSGTWNLPAALVPEFVARKVLTVYLWISLGVVLAGLVSVALQHPLTASQRWLTGFLIVSAGVLAGAIAGRGLPYAVRYGMLATTLSVVIVVTAARIGVAPTWVVLMLMLISSTGLFYGVGAGVWCGLLIGAVTTIIAFAWTQGVLPDAIASPQEAMSLFDFRRASVWVRVLITTGVSTVGLVYLLEYVVRGMNRSLEESTKALQQLSVEQKHRADTTDALLASEEKFSTVFYANPNPILITECESGRIIDANGAFFRVANNAPREQVIGRTTLELGLWEDTGDREQFSEMIRTSGSVRDFRVYGRSLRGELAVMLLNAEVIHLGGRPAVLTMMQDITEQERVNIALRESEEKFARAFRAGPNAMAISEFSTGRYLDVSEGFERLFGVTHDEAVGHTAVELGFWRTAADRDAFMARLGTVGVIHDYEHEAINRRGEKVIWLVNADIMNIGGRKCIVMSAQDITDRRRAEVEHARAAERELRAREEFTRGLIAAQEEERKRIAGELHDSLGQNLLLLKNRAELALAAGDIPHELRWQFESMAEMASRAIAEVRQISHDLHPYQLDQLGLTRAVGAMITSAARNTGFEFQHKIDELDDVFDAEAATHVFRIVQENINNILKHARATAAKILVERDIHEVRIWVEDNGVGFEPSARGFGLKNIAERVRILGGRVNIDSAPGAGARIEILLPIASAVSGDSCSPHDEADATSPTQ